MSKVIKIDQAIINTTIEEAQHLERKRTIYNYHTTPTDPINRMLNAMHSLKK